MTASEGDRCLFKTYVAAPVVALGRSRTVTEVRCELRHWPAGVAQFSIRLSCAFENGWPSCRCLATAKDDIDIERIKLNAAAGRPVLSVAMRVDPDPRNGSRMMSLRLDMSSSASSSIVTDFTVGWCWRPWRASEPMLEAPG